MPAPYSKEPPVVVVQLLPEEAIALRQLAIRHTTSPGALAQLAIRQLLAQTQTGAMPFIVPSTVDRAEPFQEGAITLLTYTEDR